VVLDASASAVTSAAAIMRNDVTLGFHDASAVASGGAVARQAAAQKPEQPKLL